jgi:hypothetical protein
MLVGAHLAESWLSERKKTARATWLPGRRELATEAGAQSRKTEWHADRRKPTAEIRMLQRKEPKTKMRFGLEDSQRLNSLSAETRNKSNQKIKTW